MVAVKNCEEWIAKVWFITLIYENNTSRFIWFVGQETRRRQLLLN